MATQKTKMELNTSPEIKKIKETINKESIKNMDKQRFGFFSIPMNPFIGDQSYSYSKKRVLDEMGKVKFEERNVVTKPLKEGRFGDAYFSNDLIEDKHVQAKIKAGTIEDYNNKIAKVKDSKKQKEYKPEFFPASVKNFPD